MILYSLIMFLAAIPMFKVSVAIYKGRIDLIHDYHQTRVTDKAAYGRAFGRAMLVVSSSLLLSGIIGLFSITDSIATIAVVALFVGLFIGIALIVAVQIKYNKGIF